LCYQVVHAIARSRILPERAEQIVNRLEQMYESGDGDIQPDVVCYDALINAYGWSNQKGKSLKCFEIYEKMLHLYRSRKNPDAKPDIITCNSVLNACAFEDVETAAEHAAIMNVAVQILEDFQSSTPTFGRPTLPTPTPFGPLKNICYQPRMLVAWMTMAKNTNWRRLPFGIAARSVA
jgi:hypothetical protein